jgi:hypothetical protein
MIQPIYRRAPIDGGEADTIHDTPIFLRGGITAPSITRPPVGGDPQSADGAQVSVGDLNAGAARTIGMGFAAGEPRRSPNDGAIASAGNSAGSASGNAGGSAPDQNSSGAGLAGNGPLVDALTQMLAGSGAGGAGYDASASPSTAAVEALAPQAQQTTSASNPAAIVVVVAIALAIGAFLYFKHKGKRDAAAAH